MFHRYSGVAHRARWTGLHSRRLQRQVRPSRRPDRRPTPSSFRLVYSLSLRPTGPTLCLGGVLDVVVANDLVDVKLLDVGLSDHQLLAWRVPLVRSLPDPVAVSSGPWKRLDMVALRTPISTSLLCRPGDWPDDVDTLAAAYD